MRIKFDKMHGFVRNYDGTRYFTLFGFENSDAIYNRIRYFINLNSSAKTKVDFFYFLPIEKRLTMHNVTILIKSVLNRDKNHYYYKVFIKKCSYQLTKI